MNNKLVANELIKIAKSLTAGNEFCFLVSRYAVELFRFIEPPMNDYIDAYTLSSLNNNMTRNSSIPKGVQNAFSYAVVEKGKLKIKQTWIYLPTEENIEEMNSRGYKQVK